MAIVLAYGTELNVIGGYPYAPKAEVVIKIPQDDLQILRQRYSKGAYRASTLEQALVETILNGTILPKGHGKLIAEPTEEEIVETIGGKNDFADCIREAVKTVFANALTIIEADTESEDKE